jgi:tetratricopeptide (TPR) repeat protein
VNKIPWRRLGSCLVVFISALAAAQTFEIGGEQQSTPSADKNAQPTKASPERQDSSTNQGIGWGSSIEVGRNTRAAEDALKHRNYSAAITSAERAVQSAPGNARGWFLLGYASRLASRLQQSLDAYNRGLQLEPGNLDGLSGSAQTLAKMGRTAEAQRILLQVVNRDPKRVNDLLMAGQWAMLSGDLQQGVSLLTRAETARPSAFTEVMLATAYLKLKDPERARQMLDAARRRDPRNPDVFRAVANFQRSEHDYKPAIATLSSSPTKNADLLGDLAYTYELDGDKQNAADTYARAAKLAPQQIGIQLSAANAQLRLGALDATRSYLAIAEKLDANHYRVHALRALLARAEDRNKDAIAEYEAALRVMPESVPEGNLYPIQLMLNLADLNRQIGNDAAARQHIEAAQAAVEKLQIEGPARAEFLRVRASIRVAGNDMVGAESDLVEALKLDPNNVNTSLQYGNLLWRLKRADDAHKVYEAVLARDPANRYALEAMGYLARESGDNKVAEQYFEKLAKTYPTDYVPYLALGDLYAAIREFERAEQSYAKANSLAPDNPVVISNAANTAIEASNIPRAAVWVSRAKGRVADEPRVMRERERVAFHEGKYVDSARLGEQVVQHLPNDRNASVYLGYALYNLGRLDDVLSLTTRYSELLPKEPNFPLLTGHVHKQRQLLYQAADDYTAALKRDPKMVEALVNRGYVENDLQNGAQAMLDFNAALKQQPNNGTAHLGLAFSSLQVRNSRKALEQVDVAEKILGESGSTHLARATAYRQMRLLQRAEAEYQTALKFSPNDLNVQLALADTEYHLRHYERAIDSLNAALSLSPDSPLIYAQLAHAHARLHHREEALRYVEAAEKASPDSSDILLNTGDALMILGDQQAAEERLTRALFAADGANRVDARLAFARLFFGEGKVGDARQQIALAFAEARVGEAPPVTPDQLIEAANLFLGMNDFDLAQRYFQRAKQAGAADEVVAIGMANSYLAQSDPLSAQAELAVLGSQGQMADDFDYTLAMANVYRQKHDGPRALTVMAHANELSGDDDVTERQMLEMAGEEGLRLNQRLSVESDFTVSPIYDDTSIYGLDQQIFAGNGTTDLPPPRSSMEYRWTNLYRYNQPGIPMISGFMQLRKANGEISLPSEALIIHRSTLDTTFNSALNPTLRLGRAVFQFNTGLQFTIRRDSESPVEMNQNLFRQFAYLTTNSLFNWLTIRGEAFHEAGPFTESNQSSREVGARIEFAVGRPWGRTKFLTSYSVRDLQFNPLVREFYSTTTSAGIQRKFGRQLTVALLSEYTRAWRVQDLQYWIAQSMRPAARVEYRVNNRWSAQGYFSFSRGMGFHNYDNVESSVLINYVKPFRRKVSDGTGEVSVQYPLSFSFGLQSANYFNFTGHNQTIISPVVRLTLF